MGFRVVAKTVDCEGGNCPTTYVREDEEAVIVQGFRTPVPGRLRVTADLLHRHAAAEGQSGWSGPTIAAGDGWVLVDGRETDLEGVAPPANEGLIEIERGW